MSVLRTFSVPRQPAKQARKAITILPCSSMAMFLQMIGIYWRTSLLSFSTRMLILSILRVRRSSLYITFLLPGRSSTKRIGQREWSSRHGPSACILTNCRSCERIERLYWRRHGRIMTPEWNGIERRLERLRGCLLKLEPLKTKTSDEFASDPYLKDIVERNLEFAAQACIDIANRMISMEQLEKPRDAYGAIQMLGKVGVLPHEFAQRLAPIASFRNILVHEYLQINPPCYVPSSLLTYVRH